MAFFSETFPVFLIHNFGRPGAGWPSIFDIGHHRPIPCAEPGRALSFSP
jgi:hypothetical protein